MAQIAWTAEAQLWLGDIHDYIAAENPAAAQRFALAIYESVRVLHEHPRLGQRYVHVTDREVRVLHHSHYRIAYLIREDTGDIDILGVFHGALQIERYLL
jgi:plasmid stabilization system protein ParE